MKDAICEKCGHELPECDEAITCKCGRTGLMKVYIGSDGKRYFRLVKEYPIEEDAE